MLPIIQFYKNQAITPVVANLQNTWKEFRVKIRDFVLQEN